MWPKGKKKTVSMCVYVQCLHFLTVCLQSSITRTSLSSACTHMLTMFRFNLTETFVQLFTQFLLFLKLSVLRKRNSHYLGCFDRVGFTVIFALTCVLISLSLESTSHDVFSHSCPSNQFKVYTELLRLTGHALCTQCTIFHFKPLSIIYYYKEFIIFSSKIPECFIY